MTKRDGFLNRWTVGGGTLFGLGAVNLLPSAGVAALHGLGFTSSGVLTGSIATGIQSSFYGPLTTGVFSSFQYLGATAVVAPPATLVSGSGAIAAGIGCLAYYHWKKQVGPKAVKERET